MPSFVRHREESMSDKVYKKIELVGCSAESIEKAVATALAKASESLHGLSWFELKEVRGSIRDGQPSEWQVTVLAGFKLD
jgi:dodecin